MSFQLFYSRMTETAWRRNVDWKARYSKLYSSRGLSQPKKEEASRISFMSNETTPYASLLMEIRANRRESSTDSQINSPIGLTSLMSERSGSYGSQIDDPLESCVHGLSYRVPERSVSRSRSRVSRMSMRRDMDIPSILAFTASPTPSPMCLGIPAFQKAKPQGVEIPRWSIRRSVCPVCSQKWRDKSSVKNIKYSGLKRNISNELPSVKAPARIRTSANMEYIPRPVPAALDQDAGIVQGGLRHGSASWLLTRARRFRTPKLQMPPPEATAPPSCSAPLARKDLELRVSQFLSDTFKISP
ncbi:uncharacterized protein LOC116771569 isoform X3 [Danaus plexippus]|uniref:uncharacterized protein LOC116771569 isoform X3 n=1 Tax=Danaus plexippus TaxID=13037 RepID=UPI002AB0041E|nr:uncharacterized protein LOC116771569 isoform X3 [Danaus plexippus]